MVKPFWTSNLKELASTLKAVFEASVNDKLLCDSLMSLAERLGPGDPAHYAPYFHYAKRLIKTTPGLLAESERLEADTRFTAGLFLPLLIVSVDGIWMALAYHSFTAIVVAFVSVAGIAAVVVAYPTRRNREVVYDYPLAVVALRTSKSANFRVEPNHPLEPAAEDS